MSGVPVTSENEPFFDQPFATTRAPRPGESLPGYLLALDELNQLDAGRIFRMVRRHVAGPVKTTRPGYLIGGGSIDLVRLGDLAGGVEIAVLERLTIAPLLRWLYGRSNKVPHGHALGFRLCPVCVSDGHIALVSLFADVLGCAQHGVAFVERCGCGAPIMPLLGQDRPFTCHEIGCEQRYALLAARPLSAPELEACVRGTSVYVGLLDHASTSPTPAPSIAALASALRTLYERMEPVPAARWKLANKPGIRAVAATLLATGATAQDLQALLTPAARIVVQQPVRVRGRCPNPRCASNIGSAHPGFLVCAGESQCRVCGTRFTPERTLFSFDDQPGYRRGLGARNDARLQRHRFRLSEVCEQWVALDRSITRDSALRAAGVAPFSVPHLSERAGLLAIIAEAQGRQRALRLARAEQQLAAIDVREKELRVRVGVLGLASAIGVDAACKRYGVVRSRFYRWKAAHARAGLDGLRATCPKRRAPIATSGTKAA